MSTDETEALISSESDGLLGVVVRYKRALFFGGLTWFGFVLAGGLYLSTIDARTGLHVFGSNIWVANQYSALRVSLRDLRLSMNRPISAVEIRFVDQEGRRGPPIVLDEVASGFVQGDVLAPSQPGRWTIHFRAEDEGTPLTARLPIDILPQNSTRALDSLRPGKDRQAGDTGGLDLNIEPLDGAVPSGLPGKLLIRAFRGLEPVSTEVTVSVTEGRSRIPLPSTISIPAHGFVTVPVHAVHPVFQFRLNAEDSSAERRVRPVPTQFSIAHSSSVTTDGYASLEVRSLHQNGDIFIDIWRGEHWLSTTQGQLKGGAAKLKVKLPALNTRHDVLWLQVYRHAYMPGEARDGRYLLVTRDSRAAAVRWLAGELTPKASTGERGLIQQVHASDTVANDHVRALLGRLARPEHSPPLLADSGETVIQTVSDLKATWLNRFVIALVISGLLMFLIVGMLLYSNQREVERGWALAGGADDGAPGTRRRLALQASYLFLILAVFVLGMIQLVLSIHW